MFDPQRIDIRLLDLVDRVIAELVLTKKADGASIMVIGAHCRDLLHASFGRADPLRSTDDVDIAVAVDGDAEYDRIVSTYPRSGTTEIRYSIAGAAVDVVPFGEIEDPQGTAVLSARKDSLDVFGFREVFTHSIELPLPCGAQVRFPTPPGYIALKLKAWCDRSVNGQYKDAGDIAIGCSWYQDDADIRESLYGPRADLLLRADMDVDIASLHILGEEISAILGEDRVSELSEVWKRTNRELLAEYFARQKSTIRPDRAAAHRAIDSLTTFLN